MRLLAIVVALLALVLAIPVEGMLEHMLQALSFGGAALSVTFPTGDQGRHYVSDDWDGTALGAGTATWVAVDGLGDYTRQNNANTTDHRIFGRAQAISTVGTPARTINLSGWYADGDAGQNMLRAYAPGGANAGEVLAYMYLRDGSDGYAVNVQVGGGEERSSAEGGLQPTSFTLAPQSDPVALTGITP